MKATTLIAAVVLAQSLSARAETTEATPRIAAVGPTLQAFVPSGYEIESQIEADFNADGLTDAALLIVPECKSGPEAEILGEPSCKAEGRILVILFRQAHGGYRRSVSRPLLSGVGTIDRSVNYSTSTEQVAPHPVCVHALR